MGGHPGHADPHELAGVFGATYGSCHGPGGYLPFGGIHASLTMSSVRPVI